MNSNYTKKLKDKLRKNAKIHLFDAGISLSSGVQTPLLKDILESNVDESYYLPKEKSDKILSLANLKHSERKFIVKNKQLIPPTPNAIPKDYYICTHHLGQNGSLFSPICRTITCSDIPHIIAEDSRIRKLTITECEALMSWPKGYTKYGKKESGEVYEVPVSQRYKKVGNGIVSNVSKYFVESLLPTEKYKVMSICSGVDGSCLALDKRFTTVGFCEFDKKCQDILRFHYPEIPIFHDLTNLSPIDLPNFDILFASPPCQAFSQAGQRKGLEDARGTLFYDMARILKDRKPPYFVFENVKGLLSHDQGKTFEIILETFCELGYEVDFDVLNAKNFGVPQNRERVFIFGRLKQ